MNENIKITAIVSCLALSCGLTWLVGNSASDQAIEPPKATVANALPSANNTVPQNATLPTTAKPSTAVAANGLPASYLDNLDADKEFANEEALSEQTPLRIAQVRLLFRESAEDEAMHLKLVGRFLDKHFANHTKAMEFFDFYKRQYAFDKNISQRLPNNSTGNQELDELARIEAKTQLLKSSFTPQQYQAVYATKMTTERLGIKSYIIFNSKEANTTKITQLQKLMTTEENIDPILKNVLENNIARLSESQSG
jgi:hypothetical protein